MADWPYCTEKMSWRCCRSSARQPVQLSGKYAVKWRIWISRLPSAVMFSGVGTVSLQICVSDTVSIFGEDHLFLLSHYTLHRLLYQLV